MSGWNTRDDVAEELEHAQGWLPADPDYGDAWVRRRARWGVIAADGSSLLAVDSSDDGPGYSIPFGPNVPHFVIVKTCAEAAADCPRCGTACEQDCMEPDGVVFGRDGDGTAYGEIRR